MHLLAKCICALELSESENDELVEVGVEVGVILLDLG
jgi:hypothetical protein